MSRGLAGRAGREPDLEQAESASPADGTAERAASHAATLVLSLQRSAGNHAVTRLLRSDAAPLARAPEAGSETAAALAQHAPPVTAEPADRLYDLTVGEKRVVGASAQQVANIVRWHGGRIRQWTEQAIDTHTFLKELREDQWIVGAISDFLGAAAMPSINNWNVVFSMLKVADTALEVGDLELAISYMEWAEEQYVDLKNDLEKYQGKSLSGAETAVTGLKVTAAAGAAAATAATGGAAAAAGYGLLGTSAAVGATAGVYGATQETAGQSGEMLAGTREAGAFEVDRILKRGGNDAVLGFVGAFAGGQLAARFSGSLGSYLAKLGIPAVGQQIVTDFVFSTAVSPLTNAVATVLARVEGDIDRLPTLDEFVEQVVDSVVQDAGLQLLMTGLTHGATAAGVEPVGGGSRRAPADVATSSGAAPEATAMASTEAATPVEAAAAASVQGGTVQGAVEVEIASASADSSRAPVELPPDTGEPFVLESASDWLASMRAQPIDATSGAIEVPPDIGEPLVLESPADWLGSAPKDPKYAPGSDAPEVKGMRPDPRWLLSLEDAVNYVQYDPDINRRADWRAPTRFKPPEGGGTRQFGPRSYTWDAQNNLVEASTTQLTLGIRDRTMFAGVEGVGVAEGRDYGHLLGVDFGTIDAQVGRYGGFPQRSSVNRPSGGEPAQWYNAERAVLAEALRLKEAGLPFRIVGEARGFENGIPSATRLRLESDGAIVFDSGWIAND